MREILSSGVMRDGVMPGGAPVDEAIPFGDWDAFAGPDRLPEMPGWLDSMPDWPPDTLPVALWPVEALRAALSDMPGAELARVVAEAVGVGVGASAVPDEDPLEDLPDGALGDLVAACGRLQSWAAGVQARVVAERAARETNPLAHSSLVGQVTSELVVTESEGTEVVVRAESGAQHPRVIAALAAGRIDVRKAHTLLRSASQLTVAERSEAIERYLPQAPHRTWRWLQARMLAFAKARHGAAATARAEAQRRSVQLDRAENDMGWVSAYLPAADAAAVWGVVDDMAHQLRRTSGEDRNLAQLRADSLTGIVTGRLLPVDRFTDTGTQGDTDTGTTGTTGTTETTGTTAKDGPAESDAASTDGDERAEVPVCSCGGRAPVQQVIVRPVRIIPTRPVVRVTVPASVLLGLDDAPGDLNGFGPIPAETARLIAQDATWQRLVTDPVTGVLVDYSTTAYQPGRVLRAAVEARDDTCTFPGCDLPAELCDLDHIEPFDHHRDDGRGPGHGHQRENHIVTAGAAGRGQTSAWNLHALCRRHHLLKTHAGWGVVRDPATGITTWTTPTGRTQHRPPTVLDTHVDIDQVDPDTSHDLSLRALTGRRLPRRYATTEPGAVPAGPNGPNGPAEPTGLFGPGEPPF
ncbi:HNH endonuclease signature motif containing protein [Promicromonospora sp. CA-289599]|uniref:HNH endonuclease signature motif containing protein n=1 Tax=Promicromonospora sp. CA-289599 TaxID=3240014 RepID=UPI003D8CE729